MPVRQGRMSAATSPFWRGHRVRPWQAAQVQGRSRRRPRASVRRPAQARPQPPVLEPHCPLARHPQARRPQAAAFFGRPRPRARLAGASSTTGASATGSGATSATVPTATSAVGSATFFARDLRLGLTGSAGALGSGKPMTPASLPASAISCFDFRGCRRRLSFGRGHFGFGSVPLFVAATVHDDDRDGDGAGRRCRRRARVRPVRLRPRPVRRRRSRLPVAAHRRGGRHGGGGGGDGCRLRLRLRPHGHVRRAAFGMRGASSKLRSGLPRRPRRRAAASSSGRRRPRLRRSSSIGLVGPRRLRSVTERQRRWPMICCLVGAGPGGVEQRENLGAEHQFAGRG